MKEQLIYTVKRGRVAYTVDCALGNMRKSQEWVIYPVQGDAVKIQCENRIARFSLLDGKGVISKAHASGAYGHDLSESRGAKSYQFPMALVEAINESPVSGNLVHLTATKEAQYIDEALAQ